MSTASPFLALPGEIRNDIYAYYVAHEPAVIPPSISRSPLALSLTCRQLYDETHKLAFSATTFKARCWLLQELRTKFGRIPRAFRPLIKRLELTVHFSEFVKNYDSLEGLMFADAGLNGLEELYIVYTGQPRTDADVATLRTILEIMLWKTVLNCGNNNLLKIRLVHGGALGWFNFRELCTTMPDRLSPDWARDEHWETQQDFEEGRFSLVKKGIDNAEQRRVSILFGYTVRETELYREVREKLLEGRVLETLRGRRPDCDIAELSSERLAYYIRYLAYDFGLPLDFHLPNKIDATSNC